MSPDIALETAESDPVREPVNRNHSNVTLLGQAGNFFKKAIQAVTRHPKKEEQKCPDSTEGHGAVANLIDRCPATEEDGVAGVELLNDSEWYAQLYLELHSLL